MGLKDTEFFDYENYESSDTQIIICKECSSHLCLSQLILSDEFTGSSGPAYLVDNLINYQAENKVQESKMHTGTYLIKSVGCKQCKTRLGWTYKKAYKFSEAYKEGKFVIEKKFIKFIPNNSAPSDLILQAQKNIDHRRRRSSATISSSSSSINESLDGAMDNFKYNNLPLDPINKTTSPTSSRLPHIIARSLSFRDIYTSNRLRFQGTDKEFEEEDEDVFVDV